MLLGLQQRFNRSITELKGLEKVIVTSFLFGRGTPNDQAPEP